MYKIIIIIFLLFNEEINAQCDTITGSSLNMNITLYPSDQDIGKNNMEGDEYMCNFQIDLAWNKYKQAIKKKENLSYSYWNLGNILIIQKRINRGLVYIDKAIENTADSIKKANMYVKKANYCDYFGKYIQSNKSLFKAISYDKNNIIALSILTEIMYDENCFNCSIYYGKRLQKIDSSDTRALLALGMAALEIDSFSLAVKVFTSIFHQDSIFFNKTQEPILYRSLAYYGLSKYQYSINDINSINPNLLISDLGKRQYYYYKALIYIKLGNYKEARKSYISGKNKLEEQQKVVLEKALKEGIPPQKPTD
jgi:tetratricopeptide (TPR) repeat protein